MTSTALGYVGRSGGRPADGPERTVRGRTVVVAAACLLLLVVLASPLQTYLGRRSAVSDSVHEQARLKQQTALLQQENAQWSDPAYVARQARARLGYVRPGDTLYKVLGPDGAPRQGKQVSVAVDPSGRASWNVTLWDSVRAAGG